MSIHLTEARCPVCKRQFIPAIEHLYKINGGRKVCSYKCRCAWEKTHEAKKGARTR